MHFGFDSVFNQIKIILVCRVRDKARTADGIENMNRTKNEEKDKDKDNEIEKDRLTIIVCFYTLRNFENRLRPSTPLFSGWNCVPNNFFSS